MKPVRIVIVRRRVRDPGEAAHCVHEVLFAGPGQHHPRQQDQPAEPHGHRQCVDDAGGVPEQTRADRRYG